MICFKKVTSIILTIFLCAVTCITDISAEEKLEIFVRYSNEILPIDSKICVLVTPVSDAKCIYIYDKSTPYEELIGKIDDITKPETLISLQGHDMVIVAKAFNKFGNLIAISSDVRISGGRCFSKSGSVHDFTFEEDTTIIKEEKTKKDTALTIGNGKSVFTGYTGTGTDDVIQNSITIDDSIKNIIPNDKKGRSLHLVSRGISGKKTQINSIGVGATKGIIIFQMDFYTNNNDGNIAVLTPNHSTAENENVWDHSLMYNNGTFSFEGGNICVGTVPKWSEIMMIYDIENATESFLVDGVFIGVYKVPQEIISLNRLGIELPSGAQGDIWIDNLSVKKATLNSGISLARVRYFEDEHEVYEPLGKKVTAVPIIVNHEENETLMLIARVYRENQLINIEVVTTTVTSTEQVKTVEMNLGGIAKEDKVNILLWNKNLQPMSTSDSESISEKHITSDIYQLLNFEYYYMGSLFNNGNILERTKDKDNNGLLHFKRITDGDFYWELPNAFGMDSDIFVYQFDLKLVNDTSTFIFSLEENSGYLCTIFSIENGRNVVVGDISYILKRDSFATISVLFDTIEQIYSIYVDGEKITDDLSTNFNFDNGKMARWCCPVEFKNDEFYIDNFVIYGGYDIKPNIVNGNREIVIDTSGNRSVFSYGNHPIFERPTQEKIKEDYLASSANGQHPRIYKSRDEIEEIRQRVKTDEKMKKWYNSLLAKADALVLNPQPIEFSLPDGIRLMYVAQDFQDKILTLSVAYQLTSDERYAQRAYIDMEASAKFYDWNPRHPMDVGIMSSAYAFGYDWLYQYFSPDQRSLIEQGAYKNGFYDYNLSYMSTASRMGNHALYTNNHGPIHNGGAILLGLAFMDVFERESAYLIANGIRGVEYSIENYAPDGAWFEGPAYASLALEYFAYIFSGLESVLGSNYGLKKVSGLDKAAEFMLYIQSPMGSFDLTEGGSTTDIAYTSAFLFFADYFNKRQLIQNLYSSFDGVIRESLPLALLWYYPAVSSNTTLPLDLYAAEEQIITMRDSWNKDMNVFVGFKGCNDSLLHKHLNMGTFAYYANGVKWATDIGYDNYDLPYLRWELFRQRAEAHNCLVIDPQASGGDYEPEATASFTKFLSNDNGGIAIVDMTQSHGGRAISAKRGFVFTDNRRSLVVRDELELDNSRDHTIYWFMQTKENVDIQDDEVILTDKKSESNKIKIEFLSNKDYELTCGVSSPLPESPKPAGNTENTDVTRIMLKIKGRGSIKITAKLTPLNISGGDISNYDIPMEEWVLE